jgi:hypothetical protein
MTRIAAMLRYHEAGYVLYRFQMSLLAAAGVFIQAVGKR